MNKNHMTLTIRVTEVVDYVHTLVVTEELLDQAEAEGYRRTIQGVMAMLSDDPDHPMIVDDALDTENFEAVTDRTVRFERA